MVFCFGFGAESSLVQYIQQLFNNFMPLIHSTVSIASAIGQYVSNDGEQCLKKTVMHNLSSSENYALPIIHY